LLPTFFIIGAAKAATTTVWSSLREHPDVFLPGLKEPNYLLGDEWSRRGLRWYESLYAGAGAATARGDASPGYSMFPLFTGVPDRAAALVPDARIIYIIRHPVERMASHWTQATTAGYEHRSLNEALISGSLYFFSSCYGLQLSRWAAVFPREALLVLRSEDLDRDPAVTIDRILTHLGLEPGWRPSSPAVHRNALEWKVRSPRKLRAASGALRGAGLERAARHLTRRTRFKTRLGILGRYPQEELDLDQERAAALFECFRADFALLRQLVGSEIDLYGLA
jgi:hypothetical protein